MIIDMIKKIYVIFLVFFCFGCSPKESGYMPIGNSDSSKENIKEFYSVLFIEKFYKLYNPYIFPNNEENRLNDFLSKNGNEYLTKKLKSLILEDIKCRQDGYVCNLEVDPFYNSQDKIILLNVLKESEGGYKVSFDNKSELRVILDCTEKKCLISNIVYPDGSNLLEALK